VPHSAPSTLSKWSPVFSTWRRYIRPQDFVWLVLFAVLAAYPVSPDLEVDPRVVSLILAALGIVQVLEPRIGTITTIVLELVLCFVLFDYSGEIGTSYYLILLLPVISASTNFGLRGTVLSTLAACSVYLYWLTHLNLHDQNIIPGQVPELVLRVAWCPVIAFLSYQLAQANREQTLKAEAAVLQLGEANKHLQEAQAEVRRTERLAALGQLTAGLAHELRNPLGTMKTSAELLQRHVAKESEIAREMAGYIATEVDRTNSLITRFLDFAKPQHLRLEKGDLAELLDRVIDRFEREKSGAAASVSIYKNYSPDIPPVAFDEQLLERVIVNLLNNAAQASPPGAMVTVKTQMVETDAGRGVEIAVIDRGSGIDPKNRENIFNPFFTTKSDGVGLGLAIVSKIVDEHGGRIAVESTPGEGSVFQVILPVRQ
jgi:two-component system, NtrC family, sensor histidine kinase HydH